MPWLRSSGVAYVAIALVLLALAWRMTAGRGEDVQPSVDPTAAGQTVTGSAPRAAGPVVHVAGAVRRPGVYRLAPGARVTAAVATAGGAAPGAALELINLAARAVDGQQIVVPERVAPGDVVTGAGSGPVSLGSATAEQLESIDGIGPTLAARIVAWRTENGGFRSLDQLVEVPGIGEGRLATIREQIGP